MERVQSGEEFDELLEKTKGRLVIGFFGDFSAASRQALPQFEKFCRQNPKRAALLVDVGRVKGLHRRFGVDKVPTVLLLDKGKTVDKIVGPQSAEYYARALDGGTVPPTRNQRRAGADKQRRHNVVLYVGASCPWCAKARTYLRQNQVPFREIDVSRDPAQATRLVSSSGHQGVPQLNIDGHWVIGFDLARINSLLGLRGRAA